MEKNYGVSAAPVAIALAAFSMMMVVVMDNQRPRPLSPREKCEIYIQAHRYDGSYIADVDTCDRASTKIPE